MTAPHRTHSDLAAAIRSAPPDSPLAEIARLVTVHLDALDASRTGDGARAGAVERTESALRDALALPLTDDRGRIRLAEAMRTLRDNVPGRAPDPHWRSKTWQSLQAAQSVHQPWWRRAWRRITRRRQS